MKIGSITVLYKSAVRVLPELIKVKVKVSVFI